MSNLSSSPPETRFIEDLQMSDPLEGVELALGIQEEFDIKIPDEDAERINTVGELIGYLIMRVQPKAG